MIMRVIDSHSTPRQANDCRPMFGGRLPTARYHSGQLWRHNGQLPTATLHHGRLLAAWYLNGRLPATRHLDGRLPVASSREHISAWLTFAIFEYSASMVIRLTPSTSRKGNEAFAGVLVGPIHVDYYRIKEASSDGI